jgi:uncharacterized RDD family membrane protein YckC
MHCLYCGNLNPEDEPRCQRCGRRLQQGAARPAPDNYIGSYSAAATAVAPALEQSVPAVEEIAPSRAQIFRQTRLFTEGEGGNLLQFPAPPKPPEPKARSRRHAGQASDSPPVFDFLAPTPHSPRALKTSVEAVIYCDAPVATLAHRAVGFDLDFSIVTIAFAVFLLTFHFCGGEFDSLSAMAPGFGGAFALIALSYGLLWVLTGSETAGARWIGLRLINFDGSPIDRNERAVRFAAACLSICSAGLGVIWSLADEESLTWHDHMSKTFPTFRV